MARDFSLSLEMTGVPAASLFFCICETSFVPQGGILNHTPKPLRYLQLNTFEITNSINQITVKTLKKLKYEKTKIYLLTVTPFCL